MAKVHNVVIVGQRGNAKSKVERSDAAHSEPSSAYMWYVKARKRDPLLPLDSISCAKSSTHCRPDCSKGVLECGSGPITAGRVDASSEKRATL